MHRCLAALLVFSALLASGCISGQTIKRMDADIQDQNTTALGYEPEPTEQCTCPDSFRTCPDGFNTTCENSCNNGSCTRCTPDCAGHEGCSESWFCSEWHPCSNSTRTRRCIDKNYCNNTAVTERRACIDACSTDSDCPRASGCSAYVCRGSPKACKTVALVPCCGDGICDAGESCTQDCPEQRSTYSQQTQNPNITITNIAYKTPEFAEIWNLGDANQDMTSWTLSDNSNHVFTFPGFTLNAGSSVRVHTESGADNTTDLYWNRRCYTGAGNSTGCVWNDKGDAAALRSRDNKTVSALSY